jgi:hypothetical protein
LEKGFFQAQEGFPGLPFEEELEEFLVKLKLLAEGKLVESLVDLKLLAEVKMDSSLGMLGLLLERGMVEPLVKLDLRHVEEKNSPQVGFPMFLLQVEGECQ